MNSDNFSPQEDIKSQTIKDLDFLLDSPSVKNLKKLLSQKKYLLEKDKLHQTLKDAVEQLDFNFRDKQNAQGLSLEYNPRLTDAIGQTGDFVRVPKEDNIYYGQINSENLKHGIGTLLYDNNFYYLGMFENDAMTGIGISGNPNVVRYMGEHKEGSRDGRGILYMADGREYEGTWRENRMHGRGLERTPDGQQYITFNDNGKTLEIVTMGKESTGLGKDHKNANSANHRASQMQPMLQDREEFLKPHKNSSSKKLKDRGFRSSNLGNSSSGSQGKYFVDNSNTNFNSSNRRGEFSGDSGGKQKKEKEKCIIF